MVKFYLNFLIQKCSITKTKKILKTLGVDENINDSELLMVYKELIKKYHPDNNLGMDVTEKFVEIQNAYKEIVAYRTKQGGSNIRYEESIKRGPFKPSDVYIMLKDTYDELMNYISMNYDSIPKKDLRGFFGRGRIVKNKIIQECDLEFIDGYTQIATEVSDCSEDFLMGLLGPTKEVRYNFINKDGEFLFKYGKPFVFTYLGRNIFLNVYSDCEYYLCSPNKDEKFIKFKKGEFSIIYNYEKFLDDVILELNRKYYMEAFGMKYVPTKKAHSEWVQKSEWGSKSNIKKMVLRFVEEISQYDDMTKDMYYSQALADDSSERQIKNNNESIKLLIKKIKGNAQKH